ncbi:MAG: hypothetical protein ACFFD4_40815, partial [Candidatus Odinarchaeota archaeon]
MPKYWNYQKKDNELVFISNPTSILIILLASAVILLVCPGILFLALAGLVFTTMFASLENFTAGTIQKSANGAAPGAEHRVD